MLRNLIAFFLVPLSLGALDIVDRPIPFSDSRVQGTLEYLDAHYGIRTESIAIAPRVIVVHATGINTLDESLARFLPEHLSSDRGDIAKGGTVNVAAHFLVDYDGTVYRLMDETVMGRHVIGLNYSSIGIENVGGAHGDYSTLTEAQLQANRELVAYLKARYPDIIYLIGHHEYRCMETTPLWLERDPHYRTRKTDPGERFMRQLRDGFETLQAAPCGIARD